MENIATQSPAPQGYSTVCPYLMVDSIELELEFLKNVFNAEILEQLKQPDGSIMHGEVRIVDTVIMMGKSRKDYPPTQSMTYVFNNTVDETYERALKNGATSLMEPGNRFYGIREAGVKDPQGNQWWIAQPIENITQAEMEKRLAENVSQTKLD
ncbi:MAG: VOC family protein [Bacteroidota bacterium]